MGRAQYSNLITFVVNLQILSEGQSLANPPLGNHNGSLIIHLFNLYVDMPKFCLDS